MAKNRNREETINTQLAILVSKLGVTADAETIQAHGTNSLSVLACYRPSTLVHVVRGSAPSPHSKTLYKAPG